MGMGMGIGLGLGLGSGLGLGLGLARTSSRRAHRSPPSAVCTLPAAAPRASQAGCASAGSRRAKAPSCSTTCGASPSRPAATVLLSAARPPTICRHRSRWCGWRAAGVTRPLMLSLRLGRLDSLRPFAAAGRPPYREGARGSRTQTTS